ncbi:RNA 2',3'-cyclic phosphodiesterase [Stakelama saccharophila]|uniref:RNA 2',3'-cyclic phosphodiesterase n=1 Tax=Stakelama saccharophila TaxID=3075605 RepID=A0ABZ0BAF3_9SPHN|nr:RNA 2',3'-cyclic phosphodiesterase [Stakelama sp. W311]WNO54396.1 RNA 2',3'-cyclic phosphodiesterase [Stakelama sp. W311]
MHRLFVGLRPPRAMRERLLAVMGGIENARWQSAEQLHCTLRFIGEVERPLAEDIAAGLGHVRFPSFDLALAGIGQFGPPDRPRALWAGLGPTHRVAELHRKIDRRLVELGLETERRAYLPHITLARLNSTSSSTSRFREEHAGLESPPLPFHHFLLYRSTLGSEGASYEAIARYPLRD